MGISGYYSHVSYNYATKKNCKNDELFRQPHFAFPPADLLFLTFGVLKVHDLFKLKIAKFIYNSLNKHNPINFHSWFILSTQTHRHNTTSKFIDIESSTISNNLFIPIARTTHYGLKSLKVQGPNIWNMIPPAIRNNSSLQCFTNELKIYLMNL